MPIVWRKSILSEVEPWPRDGAISDGSDYEPAPKAAIDAVEDGAGHTSFDPIPAYREAALAYYDVVCTSNIWHGRAGALPALHLRVLEFVFYDGL